MSLFWYQTTVSLIPSSNEITDPDADDLDLEDQGETFFQDCDDASDLSDLRSCPAYLDFLASYHAKYAEESTNWIDQKLNSTITGASGFHHFDIDDPENDFGIGASNIIFDQTFPGSDNSVIYIKGSFGFFVT